MVGACCATHGSPPRELKEVVALLEGQTEAARQRGQYLFGGDRAAPLLDPVVVVDGDPAERGHLLSAESGSAPPRSGGQADVLRAKGVAPRAEEVGELVAIHDVILST
jgi:hypothetical protein